MDIGATTGVGIGAIVGGGILALAGVAYSATDPERFWRSPSTA